MQHPGNRRRLTGTVLLTGSLLLLVGCSSSGLTRTFGLTRDAPDEFTVTTRAPLSMPPEFNLRPPQPGAVRPQEQSERTQAEEALVPQMALGAPKGGDSPGQEALLQQIGPAAPADIRRQVDSDARVRASNDTFVDKLLYWRKPDQTSGVLDASKEAQRLRQSAALGTNPETGQIPIIQERRKGWFQDLFSWVPI
jgi:hypothetical protein